MLFRHLGLFKDKIELITPHDTLISRAENTCLSP